MKVKVIFGNDIRRWRYPQSQRYQNLLNFIKQTFNFLDERQFYVQFEDDEGDRLTLTSETDFEDAFSCAEQEGRKSLKIFIMKGSIEDSHNNDQIVNNNNNIDNLSSISFSSPSVAASRAQPLNDEKQQEQQPKLINNQQFQSEEKAEIENDKKTDEKCEESCQQNNSCSQWRQLALDFLQNKEIQLLLPQFVRRLIASLRKEQQASNGKTCLQIVNEILGEDQFKPIVNHELYTKKIAIMLPFIVERLQSYQYLLLTFNEDAIASWIPQLINILITSLANFDNVDVELDIDPIFSQFCPWFSGMNNCNSEPFYSNANHEEQIHSTHVNVACDNCQRCPITGTRYKCAVCDNYDLCSNCEALGTHDRSHPLLKMVCPLAYCANQRYNGLYEFLRLSRRHGRSHPFNPRGHHWPPHCQRRGPFAHGFHRRCHKMNNDASPNFCASFNYPDDNNKILSSLFVNDVTIPEKSYCPVDTVMTKTWRVRNDGTVEWGNDVELVFLKGDECLVLEKRYPVSNAQPGEEVDVSAIVKTPLKSGLYSAVFQLKKNDAFFGSNFSVELFAIEENDEIPESKIEKNNVICICGETLIAIPSYQAYNGARLFCNICNRQCPSEELVYHCPRNQNQAHSGGYDMCLNCAKIQMESLVSSNVKNEKNEQNENNHVDNDEKNDNDFVPIVPINSVNVDEIANNNQNDNMSAKNSEPELIEMEDISDNENNKQNEKQKEKENLDDKFEFKLQLNSLKEMGFDNVETVKFLLIKHKGDVQRVVQELLQA